MNQPSLLPWPGLSEPPEFCQYAGGRCDQSFDGLTSSSAFFLFPSEPAIIARTIEQAILKIKAANPDLSVMSWRELNIAGRIIFCEVCKAMRFARAAVTDVTTLNFNVLFELGFAIGLGLGVIPIRDTSYIRDKKSFDELGMLDTFGYVDFQNSDDLAQLLPPRLRAAEFSLTNAPLNQEQPLFLVKSPLLTEGSSRLITAIRRFDIRFRQFDPAESTRISLYEATRQVLSSLGVIVHLISRDRIGSIAHNGRCALIAGIAMARGKKVMLLQEGTSVAAAIDYRDIVVLYNDPAQVPDLVQPLLRSIIRSLQATKFVPPSLASKPLEKLDFGDLAAENEVSALQTYFVQTAQFAEVKRGHGRLVVGRKGSGKTAIFYGVRDAYRSSSSSIVLDLKPEGYQFTKLRETVLERFSEGMQEYLLTAFWNYLLLRELTFKVVESDRAIAYRDPQQANIYEDIRAAHGGSSAEQGDFSERLLDLVEDLSVRAENSDGSVGGRTTELVYSEDIRSLADLLTGYFGPRRQIWLLFDNLDKSWPVAGATAMDILILRCLLEASRKVQRQFERKNVDFHAAIFVRNDIYDHWVRLTPDHGKDTPIVIDWSDAEAFKQLIQRRMAASVRENQPFDLLWPRYFPSDVGGEESFAYLLRRTLMRPRDMIRLLKECVNVAVNRGHDVVTDSDILHAEQTYSEDQLQEVSFELRDISPPFAELLYAFIGESRLQSTASIFSAFAAARIPENQFERALDLLLWFGFLGVVSGLGDEHYAYQYHQGIVRLKAAGRPGAYVIHPAFRSALGCA